MSMKMDMQLIAHIVTPLILGSIISFVVVTQVNMKAPVYEPMPMEQAMRQIAYAEEVKRCQRTSTGPFGCYIDRATLKLVYLGSDGEPIKCIPRKEGPTYC